MAVLLIAAVAQAVPIEYGHYAAPALVHAAPIYAHAPIKHVIAEPDVIDQESILTNSNSLKCFQLFVSETGIPQILIQLWHQGPAHR